MVTASALVRQLLFKSMLPMLKLLTVHSRSEAQTPTTARCTALTFPEVKLLGYRVTRTASVWKDDNIFLLLSLWLGGLCGPCPSRRGLRRLRPGGLPPHFLQLTSGEWDKILKFTQDWL